MKLQQTHENFSI